jgi:hypothetical protein
MDTSAITCDLSTQTQLRRHYENTHSVKNNLCHHWGPRRGQSGGIGHAPLGPLLHPRVPS